MGVNMSSRGTRISFADRWLIEYSTPDRTERFGQPHT